MSLTAEQRLFQDAAHQYGLDPRILWGVYGTETNFGKDLSTSSAGAEGPMQFEPGTAKSLGIKNIQDLAESVKGAARYLAQFKSRGTAGMLSAYNAGPAGGIQQSYVDQVLKNAKMWPGGPNEKLANAARGSIIPSTGSAFGSAATPEEQPESHSPSLVDTLSGLNQGLLNTGQNKTRGAEIVQQNYDLMAELFDHKNPLAEQTHEPHKPGTPPPMANPEDQGKLGSILAEANHIAEAKVPYLWGGGHAGRVLPGGKVTPLDCSGAVSAALGINPKVASEFESWGESGRGRHITIYAKSTHVIMEIDGRFWGTSISNPGGGAGWIKPGVISPEYLSAFVARHPAGL